MSFTLPYQQKNYMGEFSSDANALTFIQAVLFDSNKNGTGTPESGMTYYDTTLNQMKYYDGSSWAVVSTDSGLLDTYYVDGDNGSDSNDGSSWANAKKTFDFLYSGSSSAISRHLTKDITINVRGTVLSSDIHKHLYADKFYGSGAINIVGETQDDITGLTPTGYDNSKASANFSQYIDVSGATWTVNEHAGKFIVFTDGTSDIWFPIMSNTSTRLETIGLPTLAGTEVFKITSITSIIKAATVAVPGTLITYDNYGLDFIDFVDCECSVSVSNLDMQSQSNENYMFLVSNNSKQNLTYYTNFTFDINKSKVCQTELSSGPLLLKSCYFNLTNYGGLGSHDAVEISYCCVDSSDGLGNGISAYNGGKIELEFSRVNNTRWGISVVGTGTASILYTSVFENTNNGFSFEPGTVIKTVADYYGPLIFKNNTTAINVGGGTWYVQYDLDIVGTGNTYDVKYQNNPIKSASFADIANNVKISNANTGTSVVYRNSSGDPIVPEEYDNTTSGLTADNYQGAIDEIVNEFVPKDGSVDFTGTVGGITPVSSTDLTTKAYVDGAINILAENLDVDSAAPEVVDTFPDTDGTGAIWHYVVKSNSGTNMRTGTFMAVWDAVGNTADGTDTSTNSIGDTSGVSLSVDITTDNVRLMCTVTTDNWSIYVKRISVLG